MNLLAPKTLRAFFGSSLAIAMVLGGCALASSDDSGSKHTPAEAAKDETPEVTPDVPVPGASDALANPKLIKAPFKTAELTALDGTKISIKTTPKGADGIAFIDSVAVMNGKQGIEVNGVHDGQSGVQMGQLTNDVAALDAKYADGTVLTVGPQGQIDDLFTSKGEIVGKDKTQRWDEHNVDGLGGKSKYDFTNKDDWSNLAKGSFESQLAKARSPEEIMFLVAQMLQKLAGKKAEEISKEAKKINESGGSGTDELAKMNFDLQQLQQAAQQFFTSATNLSKSRHDTQMAIVGNYK